MLSSRGKIKISEILAVGIGGLLLFTLGLWHQEFTGFETRFAVFAKEMLRLGPSIFPKTYGAPYPDYPATSTLLIWLCSLPFGEVNKFTAILPTAIASAIILALTYCLLSYVSRAWGFIAVCFELLTATFLIEARAISLDQMLTAITLGCFILIYRRDMPNITRSRFTFVWIFILLALGFSIRGPMGIVIPTGVICSYYAITAQWRTLIAFGIATTTLLVGCWFAMLSLARIEGGESFVADVIRMQVTGRLSGGEDMPPRYYYFVNSLGNYSLSFPFALVSMCVVMKSAWPHLNIPLLKKPTTVQWDPALRLATLMAGWFAVVLIGLSIPEAKKARYLLPAVPAMAALAAYIFIAQGNKLLAFCYQLLQKILFAIPALLIAVTLYAYQYVTQHQLSFELPKNILLFVLGACLLIQIWLMFVIKKVDTRDRVFALIAVIAFWSLNVLLREPVDIQLHSTRNFVQAVEHIRQQTPAPLAMYNISQDSLAIAYHVNVDGEFKPTFTYSAQQLTKLSPPFYLLISDADSLTLQEKYLTASGARWPLPVYKGKLRNADYRVYYFEQALTLP